MSFVELDITASHVRDKFKALLQSGFISESVITSQGVAQSSSQPAVVSTVSVAGKNNNNSLEMLDR